MTIIQEINESNYSKIYNVEIENLNKKFKLVHSFEGSSGSRESLEKWGNLMRDPTCWAYAYLKDKQGNPLKLYPFQDRLINDKERFVLCAAANQIGKTIALCVKALHHTCYVPNSFVVLVSKSEDQATRILDEIKWLMRFGRLDFERIKDEVDNRTELHLKSKEDSGVSIVKCVPPTTSALGIPATLIGMDELGFWEVKTMDEIKYFYQVLETRTNSTKNWKHPFLTMGQIVGISNPNGQRGLFWHLWDKDGRFNRYRFSWLARPENTIEEYLERKKFLLNDIFDSSYAAVFSSASGSFITEEEYNNALRNAYDLKIPPGFQLFLGGDFAGEDTSSRGVDLSALVGQIRVPGNPLSKLRMVYFKVFPPRTKKNEIYNEIRTLAQKNTVMFAYDKVGVGDSVKNDLIEKNILSPIQIMNLTYSLPNKSEVYWNLKNLFEQKRLEIRDIPQLKEQILGLRFQKTGGGYLSNGIMQSYIKIHHRSEKIHDDIADAFANSCFAAKEGTPDYEYKWIPSKKSVDELPRPKKYSQRVLCKSCGYDWNYGGEEDCPNCHKDKSNILDYCKEKPIFV